MSAYIDPNPDQFARFKALPRDTPIDMLNLLTFRCKALYPPEHSQASNGLSGREAYRLYSNESGPIFTRVGGTIIYAGDPRTVLIGADDARWDAMFIAHYPNAGAFLAMVTDPDYQRAVVHRQAAVETSQLIRIDRRSVDGGVY